MNDLDKLKSLLKEFGVRFEYNTTSDEKGEFNIFIGNYDYGKEGELVTEEGSYANCYCGFYSCYSFDENGKFLKVGVWE